jgi:hypothetical protein
MLPRTWCAVLARSPTQASGRHKVNSLRMRTGHLLPLLLLTGCASTSSTLHEPAPTIAPTCSAADGYARCGVSEEELRAINLHYADRLAFAGDLHAALQDKRRVISLLQPLARRNPTPTDLHTALVAGGYDAASIATATNAVRTAGTAFAVSVDGGCVFGSVYDGKLTVQVGGYVNDGGCLAVYGH